jgi:hypothetical protein
MVGGGGKAASSRRTPKKAAEYRKSDPDQEHRQATLCATKTKAGIYFAGRIG